jgi:hypothetical protein
MNKHFSINSGRNNTFEQLESTANVLTILYSLLKLLNRRVVFANNLLCPGIVFMLIFDHAEEAKDS